MHVCVCVCDLHRGLEIQLKALPMQFYSLDSRKWFGEDSQIFYTAESVVINTAGQCYMRPIKCQLQLEVSH